MADYLEYFIKKIFGIYDDDKENKLHFHYRNSIFRNIIIPFLAFFLYIQNNKDLIKCSFSIFNQKQILYGILPKVVSNVITFILTYINIFGEFIYLNFGHIFVILFIIWIIIFYLGKKGVLKDYFNKSKLIDRDGIIYEYSYISAYNNIINVFYFITSDFWIVYSFTSLFLHNSNTIDKYPVLSTILNFLYFIKLLTMIGSKIFISIYYENYSNLKFDSLNELNNGKDIRFAVLEYEKIENLEKDNNPTLLNKHFYILKDKFRKESTFLCVLIEETKNNGSKSYFTTTLLESNNLEEINQVFEYNVNKEKVEN